jgi:hypothetical protein
MLGMCDKFRYWGLLLRYLGNNAGFPARIPGKAASGDVPYSMVVSLRIDGNLFIVIEIAHEQNQLSNSGQPDRLLRDDVERVMQKLPLCAPVHAHWLGDQSVERFKPLQLVDQAAIHIWVSLFIHLTSFCEGSSAFGCEMRPVVVGPLAVARWLFGSVHTVQGHESFVPFSIKWRKCAKKRFGESKDL